MDNEKLNNNLIDEADLENVGGGMPGSLVYREGIDKFTKDSLVFDPDKDTAFLGDLIVKGRRNGKRRNKNQNGSAAIAKNTFSI